MGGIVNLVTICENYGKKYFFFLPPPPLPSLSLQAGAHRLGGILGLALLHCPLGQRLKAAAVGCGKQLREQWGVDKRMKNSEGFRRD